MRKIVSSPAGTASREDHAAIDAIVIDPAQKVQDLIDAKKGLRASPSVAVRAVFLATLRLMKRIDRDAALSACAAMADPGHPNSKDRWDAAQFALNAATTRHMNRLDTAGSA